MKSATGRWVSGDDFFDRERELQSLASRIKDRNHVLLTGQRRMGKTSLARQCGQQLEAQGWHAAFADVESADCPEDAIAEFARSFHSILPIRSRFTSWKDRLFRSRLEELGTTQFRLKLRAGLNEGNWRRLGEQLLSACAKLDQPVMLVIDELPIFLKRMLRVDDSSKRVDEFLSWLRGVVQHLGDRSPVLLVSGSIGLLPLVRRIRIPDRINYLFPFQLGPWDRDASVECFKHLAKTNKLPIEDGVPDAVYDQLQFGIPFHVQSFFARLQEYYVTRKLEMVRVADVPIVYSQELLGPSGQSDLMHYETRLKDGLTDTDYAIAMAILAEAAAQTEFAPSTRQELEQLYAPMLPDASERIGDALEILEHDGYLESSDGRYRFQSRLLKDWWSARFSGYQPLNQWGLIAEQKGNDS